MNFLKNFTRKKQIGLLITSAILFLDMLLYSVIIPLTPYYEANFNASPTMIGFLFSSYSITLLIFTPYFGNLTDRIGRKSPILFGLIGLIVSTIIFSHPVNFTMLVVARGLQGIAAAATWTAALALLADLFKENSERAVVMGFAMTSMSAGTLLGAPIGGLLLEIGGYVTPFYTISIFLFTVSVFIAVFLKEELEQFSQKPKRMFELLQQRAVVWILIIMVVSEGTLTLLEPILPFYLSEAYSANPLFIGAMFGVITLAYGIIAPISGFLINKYTPSYIVLIGLFLIGIFLPFIIIVKSTFLLIVVLLLIGASMGLAVSPTLTMLSNSQENSSDENESNSYGTLYSLFNIFFAISAIIGPFLGGILTDLFSSEITIYTTSFTVLIATIILLLTRKNSMKGSE